MANQRIVSPNTKVIDITQQFREASSGLRTGNLIKDDHFTLFEAVGALEIGDPKMDSGCLEEGEEMDDQLDLSTPSCGEEAIWLMDELMYREVSWHHGYPLSQTLFTSIHLDRLLWPDPKQLGDAQFARHTTSNSVSPWLNNIIRPYCLSLVKCCHLVLSMVTSQHYFEEEDFATQLFNREMLSRFPVEEFLTLLTDGVRWLDTLNLPESIKVALRVRLQFRYSLLQILLQNISVQIPKQDEPEMTMNNLNTMETSILIGKSLPEAFSLKIQRRLASSVPPRPMIVAASDTSIQFFKQFFRDSFNAYELLRVSSSGDLLTAYWSFMSQRPQPSVYIRTFVQSLLNQKTRVLGKYPVNDFITENLRSLVLPASPILDSANNAVEIPSDRRYQITEQLNRFIAKYSESYLNIFRTFCLNRERIRRVLCHAAVEWDQIQAEAEEIDESLQALLPEQPRPYPAGNSNTFAYPLSSWAYHYKLTQLRLIIQMGFELSVYAPHEYPTMHWYLSHLCGIHLSHLERISYFINSESQMRNESSNQRKKKQEINYALDQLYRQYTLLRAIELSAQALQKLYVILGRYGHLSRISPTYSSEQLRYDLRMRPFLSLSIPEPISFNEVQHHLNQFSDQQLVEQATEVSLVARKAWEEVLKRKWNSRPLQSGTNVHASSHTDEHEAKQSIVELEWQKDVRNSMRASIATSLAINTVKRVFDVCRKENNDDSLRKMKVQLPTANDADQFHTWWAVPKIVF